jgi:hypothetical protein
MGVPQLPELLVTCGIGGKKMHVARLPGTVFLQGRLRWLPVPDLVILVHVTLPQPGRVEYRPGGLQRADSGPDGQLSWGCVQCDLTEEAGVPAEHVVADVPPDGREDLGHDAVNVLPEPAV